MIREERPDGTVTYRETAEELSEQLLTHIALRMDQLLNEIMLVCPPHRVEWWEREQKELNRILRNWLMARTDAALKSIREEREAPCEPPS